VRFGNLIEGAMQALAEDTGTIRWWKKPAFRVLADHRALLAASSAIAAAQRLRLVPSRLGLPRLPVRRRALVSTGEDVWLFTGCVMDAWMRPVHEAVMRVLAATGAGVALPGNDAGCCGALHAHAGLVSDARDLARRTMSAFPGTAPILVDSAGCGAAMKDYGRLIGTDESARFSARVLDVHEWLSLNLDRLPMPRGEARFAELVAIQDPCHLRHVQKAHNSVRVVLSRYADLVELDDEGLCCGAGGAYSVQHAEMAGAIRERKLAAIARSGASVVVAANPGCAMHLAAAGVDVRHPLEIVDEVLKRGAHGG
jgi:glycolate oxidase iron-sulfur subunit